MYSTEFEVEKLSPDTAKILYEEKLQGMDQPAILGKVITPIKDTKLLFDNLGEWSNFITNDLVKARESERSSWDLHCLFLCIIVGRLYSNSAKLLKSVQEEREKTVNILLNKTIKIAKNIATSTPKVDPDLVYVSVRNSPALVEWDNAIEMSQQAVTNWCTIEKKARCLLEKYQNTTRKWVPTLDCINTIVSIHIETDDIKKSVLKAIKAEEAIIIRCIPSYSDPRRFFLPITYHPIDVQPL
jgi:hypothetical protein